MRIQNTYNSNYYNNINQQNKSLEKIASGLRINRSSDDPSGLSISERMRSQITEQNQSIKNNNDGLSLISTAEGGLSNISDGLLRMKELSVQASNGIYTSEDLKAINSEFTQLNNNINDIATQTNYNTIHTLDSNNNINIESNGSNTTINLKNVTPTALGTNTLSLDTSQNAQIAMQGIDDAISKVNNARSELGSVYNSLGHDISNLSVSSENVQNSESKIRDSDISSEFTNYNTAFMLQQASYSMMMLINKNNTDKILSIYKNNYGNPISKK
jgi:flagellin